MIDNVKACLREEPREARRSRGDTLEVLLQSKMTDRAWGIMRGARIRAGIAGFPRRGLYDNVYKLLNFNT